VGAVVLRQLKGGWQRYRASLLAINDAVEQLAKRLLAEGANPLSSAEGALHISLATVHGMRRN
jgi:hypothetical protein